MRKVCALNEGERQYFSKEYDGKKRDKIQSYMKVSMYPNVDIEMVTGVKMRSLTMHTE